MREPKELVGLSVRIDPDVHQTLVAEAARNERSLNGEIKWRLRQSVEGQGAAADDRA